MAALTPPVFHPAVIAIVADEVLKPLHDDWNAKGFAARLDGDEALATLASNMQDTIYQASFLLRGFVPIWTLDRDGNTTGVFLPHPLDLLYPLPRG